MEYRMKLSKTSKTAEIDIYHHHPPRKEDLDRMLEVAGLFSCKTLYAGCIRRHGDPRFGDVERLSKAMVVVRTDEECEQIAIRADGADLGKIMEFAVLNEYPTDILSVTVDSWDRFVSDLTVDSSFVYGDGSRENGCSCEIPVYDESLEPVVFDISFTVNEDNMTHILFRTEGYSIDDMTSELDSIVGRRRGRWHLKK